MNKRAIRQLALRYARLMEADEQGVATDQDLADAGRGARRMRGAAPRKVGIGLECPHCGADLSMKEDELAAHGIRLARGDGSQQRAQIACHDCEASLDVKPPRGFQFQTVEKTDESEDEDETEDEEESEDEDESGQVDPRRGSNAPLFDDDEPTGGDVEPHIRAPQRDSRFGANRKKAEARALLDFFFGRYQENMPSASRHLDAAAYFREAYRRRTRRFSSQQP